MIKWAQPQYLYLLLALPLMVLALLWGRWLKSRAGQKLAERELLARISANYSGRLALAKATLLLLGFFFLILAAARPQWGEKLQSYKGRGIDVVIALDASKSMLAGDIQPSRLERAKVEVSSLLDNLSANQVGITAFAGDCYVMCPLTTDVDAAKMFLDIIEPGNIPKPGTNIQRAIEVSSTLFDAKEGASKALVLITDGDNLEGDPMQAAKLAAEQGIRIYAVGVGTLEGSTIPESDQSGYGVSYKKDQKDQVVVSRLAERLLLVMAKAADGRYFRSQALNLDALLLSLDQLKKKDIGGGDFVQYQERYQYFLLAAFIFIMTGIFISDRRGKWFPELKLSRFKLVILISAFCLLPSTAVQAGVGSDMRSGNQAYKKGNYEEALKKYQEALVFEPDNVKIHYNIGRALYKLSKYPEAVSEFQLSLLTKDKKLQARTLYNIGNCQFKAQKLDEAIGSYTAALVLDPGDQQAKQNLEFCWKKKEESKSDSTKQDQQQKQQQQKQQNQQQQQQPKPQPQKGQINKDDANRMLQALQNKEKENMKKQKERQPQKENAEKDW
ncbi:VWA domain-containing protein [candidate division TA06 bacterium]|nr:VWA domain-containing protein [candidate division TA06 bacterium]